MALDKGSLASRILAELTSQGFNVTINGRDEGGWLPKFAQAISNAVIDEIQANARCNGSDTHGDSHGDVMIE